MPPVGWRPGFCSPMLDTAGDGYGLRFVKSKATSQSCPSTGTGALSGSLLNAATAGSADRPYNTTARSVLTTAVEVQKLFIEGAPRIQVNLEGCKRASREVRGDCSLA